MPGWNEVTEFFNFVYPCNAGYPASQHIVAFERPDLEAIWLQINTIEGKILVGCIYRPPDKVDGPSGVQFWDNLDQVLNDIKVSKYKYIYLLGDMNADFNTVNGQRLRQMCSRHNLCYLIEEPTRITETSATILDQVLTNAPTFVKGTDVLDSVSTSDLCTITLHLNFRISRESAYTRLIQDFQIYTRPGGRHRN